MSFDLSQVLDSSLNLDETGSESIHLDMTEEVYRLDEGLDLVVSRDPDTLQSATTLLLAVTRMKRPLARCGRGLSHAELCSAIVDSLVTETVITATQSSSLGLRRIFQRLGSEEVGSLCDISQKDVVLASGDVKLRAVTLKGGSCERKVSFKLARYLGPSVSGAGLVVVLSVTSSRHISCCMQDGVPALQLEECCKQKLQHISDDEDMDRFLFLKRTTGISVNEFESLKYRGWFISTSEEEESPWVEMCRVDGGSSRLTCFRNFEAESQ